MSLRLPILALPCLLLTACAPLQSLQPASGGPAIAGDGNCRADDVAWAIGKAADQETMARVWRESGAGLIRPIAPNQPVTKDYRRDRINLMLDADNRITTLHCG